MRYKSLSEEDDSTLLKECRASLSASINNITTIAFIVALFHFGYTITAWFVVILAVICFLGELTLPNKLGAIKNVLKARGY